jgi:hypothetical protein
MDLNWFLSATAQSCAAVVGIVAAFLTSRTVAEYSEYRNRKQRLSELLTSATYLRDQVQSMQFEWYNEQALALAKKHIQGLLREDAQIRAREEYYSAAKIPMFSPREMVLAEIDGLLAEERTRRAGPHGLGPRTGPMRPEYVYETKQFAELEREKERIYQLYLKATNLCGRIGDFLSDVTGRGDANPVLLWASIGIVVLYFVGVAYPLSLLPWTADSSTSLTLAAIKDTLFSLRGAILSVVSVVFLLVFGLIVLTSVRLRLPSEKLADLVKLSTIGGYSPFFEIFEQNAQVEKRWDDDWHGRSRGSDA